MTNDDWNSARYLFTYWPPNSMLTFEIRVIDYIQHFIHPNSPNLYKKCCTHLKFLRTVRKRPYIPVYGRFWVTRTVLILDTAFTAVKPTAVPVIRTVRSPRHCKLVKSVINQHRVLAELIYSLFYQKEDISLIKRWLCNKKHFSKITQK